MTDIFKERITADVNGEFVVFLIGLRINKLQINNKWGQIYFSSSIFYRTRNKIHLEFSDALI